MPIHYVPGSGTIIEFGHGDVVISHGGPVDSDYQNELAFFENDGTLKPGMYEQCINIMNPDDVPVRLIFPTIHSVEQVILQLQRLKAIMQQQNERN